MCGMEVVDNLANSGTLECVEQNSLTGMDMQCICMYIIVVFVTL